MPYRVRLMPDRQRERYRQQQAAAGSSRQQQAAAEIKLQRSDIGRE